MPYWLAGIIGLIVIIPLGIFIPIWDRKRYEQTKKMIEKAQSQNNKK